MEPKSRVASGTFKASFHCTPCARTSTMGLPKREPLLVRSASRCGSTGVRSSTHARRWLAAPVQIPSTRLESESGSEDRGHVESEREGKAPKAEGLEERTRRDF